MKSLSITGQMHEKTGYLLFAITNCHKFMCLSTYWQWKVTKCAKISAALIKSINEDLRRRLDLPDWEVSPNSSYSRKKKVFQMELRWWNMSCNILQRPYPNSHKVFSQGEGEGRGWYSLNWPVQVRSWWLLKSRTPVQIQS